MFQTSEDGVLCQIDVYVKTKQLEVIKKSFSCKVQTKQMAVTKKNTLVSDSGQTQSAITM